MEFLAPGPSSQPKQVAKAALRRDDRSPVSTQVVDKEDERERLALQDRLRQERLSHPDRFRSAQRLKMKARKQTITSEDFDDDYDDEYEDRSADEWDAGMSDEEYRGGPRPPSGKKGKKKKKGKKLRKDPKPLCHKRYCQPESKERRATVKCGKSSWRFIMFACTQLWTCCRWLGNTLATKFPQQCGCLKNQKYDEAAPDEQAALAASCVASGSGGGESIFGWLERLANEYVVKGGQKKATSHT